MPYSDRLQRHHLYSVHFAPRGYKRMADLGMLVAQQYLSPFDKLIGIIGDAGSGKSMLIKGMFPGLELTNDDEGVNVRPLPLLSVGEDDDGFYTAHTYHVDIRFEAAFTQMHELADCILEAVSMGKRVIVEHFDLIYSALNRNADLLIGIGEEVLVTRPTMFGPVPDDVRQIVYRTQPIRRMAHSAEDLCEYVIADMGLKEHYAHADVRHGFILSFTEKPDIDLELLENRVNDMIAQDLQISFLDENHILIGKEKHICTGPRMHVKTAGEIKKLKIVKELLVEPISGEYLLVGVVGEHDISDLNELNKI